MGPYRVVGQQTNFVFFLLKGLLGVSLMIIFVLAFLLEDEKVAEERRKQTALYLQQVLDVVAGGLASGLNVLLTNVTHLLQAAGIQVGVIFVAHWIVLLLICYGMLDIAFRLVTFFQRWLWWLLKVGMALACFGLIQNDHSFSVKLMVIRLVCLGFLCILLGIKPWKKQTMDAKIVRLEGQMKILENRIREMEKNR